MWHFPIRWSDGSAASFINWNKGEPNDFFGPEDCVEIMVYTGIEIHLTYTIVGYFKIKNAYIETTSLSKCISILSLTLMELVISST